MEIIALTVAVVTLFLVFIIGIWRELNKVSSPNYKPEKGRPKGGRYTVMNYIEDAASKPKAVKQKKEKRKSPMQFGTIADMESDGVYFNRETEQAISKEYVKKFKGKIKNKNK